MSYFNDCLTPKKKGTLVRSGILGLVLFSFCNFSMIAESNGELLLKDDKRTPWLIAPTISVGYNKLLVGYEGYGNNFNLGGDVYLEAPRETRFPSVWHHNFLFRVSAEHFPMKVPEGVLGLKEDIFSLNGALLYQFRTIDGLKGSNWVPFVGLGMGLYVDRVSLDTPATGKINSSHNSVGLNGSIGLRMPRMKFIIPFRLIPEVRYHRIQVPRGWVTNATYQLGISFWPAE